MPSKIATRLTDKVRLSIVDLIEANALRPGDKLPSLPQLAVRFAVSRTVVREAIASLKAEGRLSSRRGSGVFVLEPVSPVDKPELVVDGAELLDLMEFRIPIEIEAAGLAAERRTETHLFAMEKSLVHFRRQIAGEAVSGNPDLEFHSALATATGNGSYKLFVDALGGRLIPSDSFGAKLQPKSGRTDYLDGTLSEHRSIYDAVAARDADAARSAMRRHLRDAALRYRQWRTAAELAESPA